MLMTPIPPTPEQIAEAVLAAQARQRKRPFNHDVFISFATADKEKAEQIHNALTEEGLDGFMSCKGLTGGDEFSEIIRDALTNSREICILFSPNSAKSEWVFTEWGAAWVLKKRIVPVLYRIDIDSLPDRLRSLQAIDFSDLEEYVLQVQTRKSDSSD